MLGRNFFLLSLLMLLALAGEPFARGNTDGKPLRFDLYHGYLIVARGSAGPLKNLNFLLDTGASCTVVDRKLAQKLRLDPVPGVLGGLNGRVQAGQATVPTLQFGPIRSDNVPVAVVDLSFFDQALPVRIDAVIGLDVAGQSAFEIDYRASKILFAPAHSLKNSLPLQMKAGLPIVNVEVNHLSAHLLLDTGASSIIFFGPKAGPSISPVKVSAAQKSSNMMGQFERKQAWLGSMKLGQAELRPQSAFLVQGPADGTQDFDGLMSPSLLGITKLVIDLRRGVLEFNR